MEIPPKSHRDQLYAPTHNDNPKIDTVMDEIWEGLMHVCLSLEDLMRSPLAKEPARLVEFIMYIYIYRHDKMSKFWVIINHI